METAKRWPADQQADYRTACEGTALLPTDLIMMTIYGNCLAVRLQDGKVYYHMITRAKVSESLDVLSQNVGAMLFRGDTFWQSLELGNPLQFLRINATGDGFEWSDSPAIGGITQIASETLAADAANIDIQNIPNAFASLRLQVRGRTSQAIALSDIRCRFNNDAGANYDYVGWSRGGAEEQSTQTSFYAGSLTGTTGVANDYGEFDLEVPFYANATGFKRYKTRFTNLYTTNAADYYEVLYGGRWRSQDPVSRITIFPTAGNLKAGSQWILWGLS